jgi:hypothetical protein
MVVWRLMNSLRFVWQLEHRSVIPLHNAKSKMWWYCSLAIALERVLLFLSWHAVGLSFQFWLIFLLIPCCPVVWWNILWVFSIAYCPWELLWWSPQCSNTSVFGCGLPNFASVLGSYSLFTHKVSLSWKIGVCNNFKVYKLSYCLLKHVIVSIH